MRRITSRTVALSIALVAAVPSAAGAVVTGYVSSVRMGPVATHAGYPAVHGTAVLAGTVKTSLLGAGALVDHVKITGNPKPNVLTISGTEVGYFARGIIRSAYTGSALVEPDGTLTLRIDGSITGGSGAFRKATGSYVFKGTTPAGSSITSGGSTGMITY